MVVPQVIVPYMLLRSNTDIIAAEKNDVAFKLLVVYEV